MRKLATIAGVAAIALMLGGVSPALAQYPGGWPGGGGWHGEDGSHGGWHGDGWDHDWNGHPNVPAEIHERAEPRSSFVGRRPFVPFRRHPVATAPLGVFDFGYIDEQPEVIPYPVPYAAIPPAAPPSPPPVCKDRKPTFTTEVTNGVRIIRGHTC